MKKKYLLLFTDFFPFDKWEPYLEPEIKFLHSHFERIFIFSNHYGSGKLVYQLPQNAKAFFLTSEISFKEKMRSLRFVFSKIFWDEISWIKNHYHQPVSLLMVKIALIDLWRANLYKKKIEKFIHEQNLNDSDITLYSYWTDYRALAVAMLKQSHGFPAISRGHGWDVYFERHEARYLPFRKFISSYINHIFFVSENGKNYFLQKVEGDVAQKFSIARLAIEAQALNPSGIGSTFTIVSCARLIPLKRVHLIADILEHVSDVPVRWVHFGSGPMEENFKRETDKQLGNKKNIQFDFRGDVEHEELLKFYREEHVDLFILTSEYEGMPFVIIEALAFGIPVMATNVGGIGEVITNENGFLLEKDFQPFDAANSITRFAKTSLDEKSAYRQKAFETWNNMFNAEKNFPEFIENILRLEDSGNSKK